MRNFQRPLRPERKPNLPLSPEILIVTAPRFPVHGKGNDRRNSGNDLAIALAADSAATSVHGVVPKIFNADKLFNLGDCCPVGAMFYQGSSFLGIPWDTVVKQFRSTISGELPWLKDYARELVAFLTSSKPPLQESGHYWPPTMGLRLPMTTARPIPMRGRCRHSIAQTPSSTPSLICPQVVL